MRVSKTMLAANSMIFASVFTYNNTGTIRTALGYDLQHDRKLTKKCEPDASKHQVIS